MDNHKQYQAYLDEMPDSTLKAYIIKRVIGQIEWYDQKSVEKQNLYKRFAIWAIILNAVIPVSVLLSDYGLFFKLLVTALSSVAGVCNAINSLCGYKDLWIQYRSNCELLKSVLHRFFLRAGEFHELANDEQQLLDALVVACEDYITKEFQSWVVVAKSGDSAATPSKSK